MSRTLLDIVYIATFMAALVDAARSDASCASSMGYVYAFIPFVCAAPVGAVSNAQVTPFRIMVCPLVGFPVNVYVPVAAAAPVSIVIVSVLA